MTETEIDLTHFLATGDISAWTDAQRADYYHQLCASLGLNPLTRPIEYIAFKTEDGEAPRLTPYLNKDGAAQLSANHRVTMRIADRFALDGMYYVVAVASDGTGREVEEMGVVPITGKYGAYTGNYLANAIMKCVTKAKRRALLSFCGLGMLDETELETIPRTRIAEDHPALPPGASMLDETAASGWLRECEQAGQRSRRAILNYLLINGTWAAAVEAHGLDGLERMWRMKRATEEAERGRENSDDHVSAPEGEQRDGRTE